MNIIEVFHTLKQQIFIVTILTMQSMGFIEIDMEENQS